METTTQFPVNPGTVVEVTCSHPDAVNKGDSEVICTAGTDFTFSKEPSCSIPGIRALASARGSVARRAQRPSRKPLEGPRVAKTRESEGPKGPRTSKAQSALASATICFSRFSQKSRFSWHNLSTFTTAKMHENFNRVSYLRYKHRVKKLKQFVDQNKSYARLKFCKIVVFVSKRGRYIYRYIPSLEDTFLLKVTHV